MKPRAMFEDNRAAALGGAVLSGCAGIDAAVNRCMPCGRATIMSTDTQKHDKDGKHDDKDKGPKDKPRPIEPPRPYSPR
jgi:hypothetical protein